MNKDFWHDIWDTQTIPFHQAMVNAYLLDYFPQIASTGQTVFVPLCGKSLDMLWLAEQGYQVIGNELSDIACKAFFEENQLPYEVSTHGVFKVYASANIRIYCGDFFELNQEDLKTVDAVYDRASLIALPEDMRIRYVKHMASLLKPDTQLLVICLEYENLQATPPPFSVSDDEFKKLYSAKFDIQCLLSEAIDDSPKHYAKKGIVNPNNVVYSLTKK